MHIESLLCRLVLIKHYLRLSECICYLEHRLLCDGRFMTIEFFDDIIFDIVYDVLCDPVIFGIVLDTFDVSHEEVMRTIIQLEEMSENGIFFHKKGCKSKGW